MKSNKALPLYLSIGMLVAAIFLGGFADEDLRFKRINDALNKYTFLFPQQKVYLHIDKRVYRGGDDLWIKAYLVNALDHIPDTVSTNLYVEIITPAKNRVQIKRLQIANGFGTGDFQLSDTLPEGLYQIRAYTSWMQNFDSDFYFTKNFQLMNPGYKKIISPKQARLNKKKLEKLYVDETNDIDLQFMPEGGNLVAGLESVVAFKAINKLGVGVDIAGELFDHKGNKVTSFKSHYKGIGTFTLKPVKGMKYVAITRYDNKEIKAHLPEPMEWGVVMHAESLDDKIAVNLTSNRHNSNDPSASEIIVAAQVGGRIYFSEISRIREGSAYIEMPRNIFPSGILQITAFSSRGVPLAERLVFVNSLGLMKVHFTASDSVAEDGNKILLDVFVTDRQNRPLQANLSLSVTRDATGESEMNSDNIVSNMLVLSDLKGHIEDPLDYFKLPAGESRVALDNLMLTHGWRRFEWENVMAGRYPEIHFREEKGITISGKITRDFFNIPLEKAKVQLSIMDEYNDVFTQYSAESGTFLFENLVYYDTVSVKIEAWRPSGRKNLVIHLPDGKDDAVNELEGEYTLITDSERDKKVHRLEMQKEYQRLYEAEKKAMEERKKNSIAGLYGEPDYVLYAEDFHMVNGNILDVMKGRVPGVMITGDDVIIRGLNTLFGNTQPLYLVDGAPVLDVSAVTSIPLQDIERVEVLKGPKTAFYGARGANGVIAVYTKRGEFLIRGKIEFDMLGYSKARIFYQPKYSPEEEPQGNYTVVWSPVIVTDSLGRAKVVFDKPEIPGNYRFDFQGISYFGHVGYAESVIESIGDN